MQKFFWLRYSFPSQISHLWLGQENDKGDTQTEHQFIASTKELSGLSDCRSLNNEESFMIIQKKN